MELYPIFDENTKINPFIWYAITGNGDSPFMRVGHTVIHIGNDNDKGKLYLIGGANPDGCFNDVYILNLNDLIWSKLDNSKCLNSPRYEHTCFVDNYEKPSSIYIFAGASQENNLNELNSFDLRSEQWSEIKSLKGTPCGRTQHVGCVFRNQLVVFGGGKAGSLPVTDQQVHLYDPISNQWSTPNIKDQPPSNRHGHVMINFNDKCVYLHGGMNDQKFYDDLWILDIDKHSWSKVKQHKTNHPCGRAAHGGTSTSKNLYIFGGMDEKANSLGDFWSYSISENSWSIVKITGDNPPTRLDYAYCKLKLKYKPDASTSNVEQSNEAVVKEDQAAKDKIVTVFNVEELNEADEDKETKFVLNNQAVKVENIVDEVKEDEKTVTNNTSKQVHDTKKSEITNIESLTKNLTIEDTNVEEKEYFLIHGGMDTLGNIFDDCFIINLE